MWVRNESNLGESRYFKKHDRKRPEGSATKDARTGDSPAEPPPHVFVYTLTQVTKDT